jgi:hypothetical protein
MAFSATSIEEKNDANAVQVSHEESLNHLTATTEPTYVSLRQAVKDNGSVLGWSFFFALSAIGWCVPSSIILNHS